VLLLHVSDCGYGIKEQDQEIVFSPFFSTKRGGTGLGLAIVKKIVEAHGGEVFFQPNPERGVTFVVRLPIFMPSNSH
jgi:signal transduction histidine kinase